MKNIKRVLSVFFILSLSLIFTGCGQKGKVIYFNFKPEVEEVWKEIASAYEKETGVTVDVHTYAGGMYESTLLSKLLAKNAPTLFQIEGALDLDKIEYCYDLKDTKLYDILGDKNLAVTNDEYGVVGIPYAVEGYGIIYNKYLLKRYFALGKRQTTVNSIEEIVDFNTLKIVADDFQIHAKEIGAEGAFSSASLATGEEWRYGTHLMNYPLFFEFQEKNINEITKEDELELKYFDYMKQIFDLYITDSCSEKEDLGNLTVDDSVKEFALGKVCFMQNGNWSWEQIINTDNRQVLEDQIGILPIYMGYKDDEYNGIAIGTEAYFGINKYADKKDIKETIKFLEWLFTSKEGKNYVTNELKFITPFNTFNEDEMPSNPLAKEVIRYINSDYKNINWVFTALPSEDYKTLLGKYFYQYVMGEITWDSFKTNAIEAWNTIIRGESIEDF